MAFISDSDLKMLRDRAETAEADLAACKRDAERYRWLRSHPLLQQQMEIDVRRYEFPRGTWEQIAYDSLDAAIDAALEKRK